jgi:hypothetical protein
MGYYFLEVYSWVRVSFEWVPDNGILMATHQSDSRMNIFNIRRVLFMLFLLLLQACGGGSVGSSIVYGVAATGLAINGTVTLKDATGATVTANISQPDGKYVLDVTGMAPPYFLKATDTAGMTTLYSIANEAGNFNINPLTHLATVAATMGVDPSARTPDAGFNDPAKFANLTDAELNAAMDKVIAKMSPAFQAAETANGASNTNPLTDPFRIGSGLDKVFDSYVITLDAATGEIRELEVESGITTVLGWTDAFDASAVSSCPVPSLANAPPPASTLVVTANPACKTYDASPYSGGNGVTYSGFLNGDTPAVLGGALTYGGTAQGAQNVGTYTIIPGGLTSSNYTIVFVESSLVVNQYVIGGVTDPGNKIYSSANSGTSTNVGGLVGGDPVGTTSPPTTSTSTISVGSLTGPLSGSIGNTSATQTTSGFSIGPATLN